MCHVLWHLLKRAVRMAGIDGDRQRMLPHQKRQAATYSVTGLRSHVTHRRPAGVAHERTTIVCSDEESARPSRLFHRRTVERRLNTCVMWAGALYLLIRIRSPFTTELYCRADVNCEYLYKRPIIVGSLTCRLLIRLVEFKNIQGAVNAIQM